ncbi:MAG: hypothetical protein AAGJ29_08685 [Pseudomonadota bacterium]
MKRNSIMGVLVAAMIVAAGCALGQARSNPSQSTLTEPRLTEQEIIHLEDGRITAIGGDIRFLRAPPASLELHALTSDTDLFMFAERRNHRLSRDMIVDLSQPGDYFPDSVPKDHQTWGALGSGVIAAGTAIDSYYVHFDNLTYDETFEWSRYRGCVGQYRVTGRVSFAKPVLGIVMRAGLGRKAHLRQADRELGLPGVDYCQHNLRHFPGINIADGCHSDRFVLSEDRRTLWLTNHTDIHHDNYRIIVAAK